MKTTANRRLDAVAGKMGVTDHERVTDIFIEVLGHDDVKAKEHNERNCIGLLSRRRAEPISVVRKPGESVAAMDARAVSYPKENPLYIASWFRVYRGHADMVAEFEAAQEVQG